MSDLKLDDIIQLIGCGAMILASTWSLSRQLTKVMTQLEMHMTRDDERFRDIENDLNLIAPRSVPLRTRGR